MKKQIFSWGLMLAAAFTLTNCAQELDTPVQPETEGVPFEIVASAPTTKTVNDGMATKWVAGDQINVFHALGEETDYVNDGAFTVSDVESGKFTGTLNCVLDPEEEYDWFVFYPYSSYITTPANTNKGFMAVGSKASDAQVQTGNSNMAHIAGANYPLAGYVTAVGAGMVPSIQMAHVSSLLAINVTNNTDNPLKVTEVVFTAPVEVVGTYYINFAGEITPDSFKGSGDDYVSKSAKLTVEDGDEIAVGASAKFYLAVKPFTAEKDQKLTIRVNNYSKELELSKDVTFTAGKIKTLNFAYDYKAKTVTWNLSVDETSEATESKIAWDDAAVTMYSTRTSNSTSAANNYYPGKDSRTSTRFYKGNPLTISPKEGYAIQSVVFTATTNDYATTFKNSAWTNAVAIVSGTTITVTPEDGTETMSSVLTGTTGFTKVVVDLVSSDGYVKPVVVLSSISLSGQTTDYTVGDSFEFTGTVTATYSNSKTQNVTPTHVSSPDMMTTGDKTVTVSYTEGDVTVTADYTITVAEKSTEPEEPSTTPKFVKVTSAPSDWSGTYLIVYEAGNLAFDGSRTTMDAVSNTQAVTISNNEIEATDAMKAITFEIAKNGTSYTVKSKSGFYVGNDSNSNSLAANTTTKYNNTISLNSDGSAHIVGKGTSVLRYNATSGQTRFRYFKSSTYTGQKAIHLYKLQD